MRDPVIIFALSLTLFILTVALGDSLACSQKWGDRSTWSFFTGCMVMNQDGAYIPEKNFRVVD